MSPPIHLTQEQLRLAISELEQAISAHEQWIEEILADLICHLQPDRRDLDDHAWHNCRFGQWYYTRGQESLSHHPGFQEVEHEHKRMHQFATSLLRASAEGRAISLADYERFTSALKRMRLEIQSLKRELEVDLYNIDALTGVPGRIQMLQTLRDNHEFVVRDVHACAVAMLDVDKFKTVNDTHGHLVGDQVLKSISAYIQTHLRKYDAVFRYGGEEFLICMPDTDAEQAREICDRIRSEVGSLLHRSESKGAFRVTVSVGIAEMESSLAVEMVIDHADQALFDAKNAGRNRVTIWSPELGRNSNAA